MFKEKFGEYVYEWDSITVEKNGLIFTATIEHDADYHIDDDDSHNVDQSVTGCNARQQKRLLNARRAWFNDEWFYCGIVVSIKTNTGMVLNNHAASLWGIEANYPMSDKRRRNPNTYLTDVANELLPEAEEAAKKKIREWNEFASKYEL